MKYTRLVFISIYCIMSQVLLRTTVLSEVTEVALLFSIEEFFSWDDFARKSVSRMSNLGS